MSYGISLSGKKEDAKKSAIEQSDSNIARGDQTEAQKVAALALIDALPGTDVSGSISGHNGDTSGSISVSITSFTSTVE